MVKRELYTEEQLHELTFTDEEVARLALARQKPIVCDEDCPATTPAQAQKFKRVNPSHKLVNA